MASLWRVVIVLSFALLSMQGAQAHALQQSQFGDATPHRALRHSGHAMQAEHTDALAFSRCADEFADANPGGHAPAPFNHHHGHCPCCVAGCGVHCGAMLAAFGFAGQAPDDSLPRTHPVSRYDGITRAPPVRPPIV